MEKFTEEILKTRIQEITSVSYFNTEGAQYFKKAQDYAIKDALETSQRIANVSSVKLGSILIINSDSSPNSSGQQSYNTSSFNAYGKGMGGSGVTSSGQLITYSTRINMSTSIVEWYKSDYFFSEIVAFFVNINKYQLKSFLV